MTVSSATRRQVFVDGLRAAALLGVFVVNGLGYVDAPSTIPSGLPRPLDSTWAYSIHLFVVSFLQGKAYPLLSFLLGYSMVLSWRNSVDKTLHEAVCERRQRDRRLLLLGILHGSLIYFGDILTIYAIAGLIAAPWLRASSKVLRKKWHVWLKINIALNSLLAVFIFWSVVTPPATTAQVQRTTTFHGDLTWVEFLGRNFDAYLYQQMNGLVLTLPLVLWLILSGMLAARMRLLGHGQRAYIWVKKRFSLFGLCIAWAANFAIAALVLNDPKAMSLMGKLGLSIMTPIGVVFMLALLAWAILLRYERHAAFDRSLLFLASAGRYSLTMYLICSLTLLLTSGVALNWVATSAQAILLMLLAYGVCLLCARLANAFQWRSPLETWLSGK